MTVARITHRDDPIYHSTYTGRPPDEPAVLGLALNDVFVPILKTQFPEIEDFYLPSEACSYRIAVVSIRKQYPGHARRIMFGVWSYLRQFLYTKLVIVVDDDIDVRNWPDVIWAVSTRMDPARDTQIAESTPMGLSGLCFTCRRSGIENGLRCHQQVARRDPARLGKAHSDDARSRRACGQNVGRAGIGLTEGCRRFASRVAWVRAVSLCKLRQ